MVVKIGSMRDVFYIEQYLLSEKEVAQAGNVMCSLKLSTNFDFPWFKLNFIFYFSIVVVAQVILMTLTK